MTSRSLQIGILEGDDIGHEIVPAAVEVARATTAALADPEARTGDIRGRGDTRSMTAAIIAAL